MIENYVIFEEENHLKPDLEKAQFDSLNSWDLAWAILEPINIATDAENEKLLSKRFSRGQKSIYFFWYLDGEVTNGGFIQFYWNNNRKYLPPILEGLKLIGDFEMIKLVEKADELYMKNKVKFDNGQKQDDFEKLYEELKEFDNLDDLYYDINDNTMDLIEKYIRGNVEEFVNLT